MNVVRPGNRRRARLIREELFMYAGMASAFLRYAAFLWMALSLAACGGGGDSSVSSSSVSSVSVSSVSSSPTNTVSITPAAGSAMVGGAIIAFTATVANEIDNDIGWLVDGMPGGGSTTGTISDSGIYRSPAMLPSPSVVSITAVSLENRTLSASVNVTLSTTSGVLPVVVSLAPASASLTIGVGQKAFAATVINATDSSVIWQVNGIPGGNEVVGRVSETGRYLAPATLPESPIVTISAVSVADPAKLGIATVKLAIANDPTAVTITPTAVTLRIAGGFQEFFAVVSNTPNTGVIWTVNDVAGGSAETGTISTDGIYTAPSVTPTPATVSVAAVALADPTRSARATVSLTANVTPRRSGSSAAVSSLRRRSATPAMAVAPSSGRSTRWSVAAPSPGRSRQRASTRPPGRLRAV
jgi:hypothetical protein